MIRLNTVLLSLAINHAVLDGQFVVRPHTIDNGANASAILSVGVKRRHLASDDVRTLCIDVVVDIAFAVLHRQIASLVPNLVGTLAAAHFNNAISGNYNVIVCIVFKPAVVDLDVGSRRCFREIHFDVNSTLGVFASHIMDIAGFHQAAIGAAKGNALSSASVQFAPPDNNVLAAGAVTNRFSITGNADTVCQSIVDFHILYSYIRAVSQDNAVAMFALGALLVAFDPAAADEDVLAATRPQHTVARRLVRNTLQHRIGVHQKASIAGDLNANALTIAIFCCVIRRSANHIHAFRDIHMPMVQKCLLDRLCIVSFSVTDSAEHLRRDKLLCHSLIYLFKAILKDSHSPCNSLILHRPCRCHIQLLVHHRDVFRLRSPFRNIITFREQLEHLGAILVIADNGLGIVIGIQFYFVPVVLGLADHFAHLGVLFRQEDGHLLGHFGHREVLLQDHRFRILLAVDLDPQHIACQELVIDSSQFIYSGNIEEYNIASGCIDGSIFIQNKHLLTTQIFDVGQFFDGFFD